jgi:putative tryptophan/tyrosine transport system substrate-binding protein
MTRRRHCIVLLLASLLATPSLVAMAQQDGKVYRIGFLRNGPPPQTFIEGFKQGLRELGYAEGRNISIEFAVAASAAELPDAAAELVRRNVDVIIASGTPPVAAAKNATRTIPIVFVASIDPVATGTVASLARPGGNITGFAGIHADSMGKRLELLREVVPGLSRVAILSHAMNPGNADYIKQTELAAPALGLRLQVIAIREAGDLERAFGEIRGIGAIIQLDDVVFTSHRKQIVELAAQHRLPVMYGFREFVDVGGLIAYGPDLPDLYRRAATYVDKVLKGAQPAELPIEQPTKLELVINLRTARAIGLEIPASVLARADEVIE